MLNLRRDPACVRREEIKASDQPRRDLLTRASAMIDLESHSSRGAEAVPWYSTSRTSSQGKDCWPYLAARENEERGSAKTGKARRLSI